MKWEHKVERTDPLGDAQVTLDRFSQDGWELVSVTKEGGGTHALWFKRRVPVTLDFSTDQPSLQDCCDKCTQSKVVGW